MTKLLNKKTKEEVDVAPDAVAAAIDSGQFGFSSKRGVPVNFDGQFGYVKPEYASKHRDRLMFVNEGDVEQRQAEERFKGLGGAAQALGYGAAKGLTLGVLPALGAAISPEFAEYSKQIELGRPGFTAAGELGSLAVDPFAAAGKVLGLGAKGAKAAQEAGVAARTAESAAPRVMEGMYEVERAVPALAGAPAEAAPLRLGGRVAGAEPQAGAGFAAREAQAAAREPRALPSAGREPIAAPESPLTYQAPPFESQVMTDLRLGRADTAERLGELDRTIQSTLGSKVKGAKQSVKGLREERDALAQQLDEYDFQLLKFEQPEAQALGAQAERAAVAGEMRRPTTALTGEVSPAAPEMKLGERAAAEAEQARQRLRMGGGAPEYVGPEPGPLALGGERGLVKAEAPSVLDAEFAELPSAGPRLTPEAPVPTPAAAPLVVPGRGFNPPEGMASMAAQGGVYGASEEARRQATGESEGGLGSVLGAGAVGAALPAGMTLGGKLLSKGAGVAKEATLGGKAGPLAQRFAKAAGGVEDAHILRAFGISGKQVERLNSQFTEAGVGKKGTANFADFIKSAVSNLEDLKQYAPENEILQAIPTDKAIKFGQLTPERRTAIAEAVKAKLGAAYDSVLTPEITSLEISNDALKGIIANVYSTAVKGLGKAQFKTIAPELNAFRDAVARGESMSVGELRQMRKTLDDIFSARNGGFDKKFTPQQTTFRNAIDNEIFRAVDAAVPGTSDALRALNKEYTMAGILERGAQAAETKAATTSPIGRDLLSQAALGVAIGNPIGAAGFFIGSTFMRGIYNARGEGIIADLAGKAERAALRIQQDPVQAARQASTAIIDARRPMLLGMSAQHLTDVTPSDYTSLSRAVRELQQSRERSQADVQHAIAGLPPEQQKQAMQHFDAVVNALASEMPKGLAMDKAINEQERRYTVFARSVLDPAYATQVLVNGGPDGDTAAKALRSLGPQGEEYLKNLADDLRAKINENEKLRGNEQLQQVYRNIKSKVSVGIGGGGRARAGAVLPLGKGGSKLPPMVSAATAKNMAASLSGITPPR